MGTFGGHTLPGSFFIVFGVWWTIQIFRLYYMSLFKAGLPFKSSPTFPCSCLCGKLKNWEVEGFLKIFFTTVGFTLEIYTGFFDGHFAYYGNGQHATMFFFFGFAGVIDILVHHGVPLPEGIQYIIMAMSLTVEGLLFKFHMHLLPGLDVLVHSLLLYTVFSSVLVVLLEMAYRKSVLPALGRAYLTLLQGTWFWQLGFILYNPVPGAEPWKEDDHGQMMVATMMFAWHMAADFIIMLIIGALIGCIYRRRGNLINEDYDSLSMKLIRKNNNGETIVNLHDDSESDIEYVKPANAR